VASQGDAGVVDDASMSGSGGGDTIAEEMLRAQQEQAAKEEANLNRQKQKDEEDVRRLEKEEEAERARMYESKLPSTLYMFVQLGVYGAILALFVVWNVKPKWLGVLQQQKDRMLRSSSKGGSDEWLAGTAMDPNRKQKWDSSSSEEEEDEEEEEEELEPSADAAKNKED